MNGTGKPAVHPAGRPAKLPGGLVRHRTIATSNATVPFCGGCEQHPRSREENPAARAVFPRRIRQITFTQALGERPEEAPPLGRTSGGPASASRPSDEWNDDDFDVLADGTVVDRVAAAYRFGI